MAQAITSIALTGLAFIALLIYTEYVSRQIKKENKFDHTEGGNRVFHFELTPIILGITQGSNETEEGTVDFSALIYKNSFYTPEVRYILSFIEDSCSLKCGSSTTRTCETQYLLNPGFTIDEITMPAGGHALIELGYSTSLSTESDCNELPKWHHEDPISFLSGTLILQLVENCPLVQCPAIVVNSPLPFEVTYNRDTKEYTGLGSFLITNNKPDSKS